MQSSQNSSVPKNNNGKDDSSSQEGKTPFRRRPAIRAVSLTGPQSYLPRNGASVPQNGTNAVKPTGAAAGGDFRKKFAPKYAPRFSPARPKTNFTRSNAPINGTVVRKPMPFLVSPTTTPTETETFVGGLKDDTIRIIPLGGVEEIGKNMTIVEYKDDIIIVDAGLQFPGDEAPGVDYIIPDTTYLQKRKKNIRGMFITHGHLDHIGGIPYISDKIGNPPIFTRLLTSLLIKKRQDEFVHLPPLNLRVIESDARLKVGKHLTVRFFNVTHTIPDSMGIIIETPHGNVVFTGDVKVDHKDGEPLPAEVAIYSKLGAENNLVLLADSTNVEKPGWSFAEKIVHENLRKIIVESRGRLIIGTFASLLERIMFIIKVAEELGKKVVLRGRSMKINVAIAREIKLLKVNNDVLIPPEEIDNYPTDKIIILATGAQGDEMAALMRMANKKDKYVKLNKNDVVLLSSSVIPGNEKSVQKLKDNLSRQGCKIIHYRVADVHSSGHAYFDETLWIHKMIKPKFFIPLHGHHFMLRVHGEVARAAGMPEENIIIPDNGMIIEVIEGGTKIRANKEMASAGVVMVDGLGLGDVKDVVIRDRQVLAQDGMFIVFVVIDVKTGKVRQSPDIISRGFVYLKESQDLLKKTRILTKKTVEDLTAGMHPINFDYVKNNLREKLTKFLAQTTNKRPIVIPVLVEL